MWKTNSSGKYCKFEGTKKLKGHGKINYSLPKSSQRGATVKEKTENALRCYSERQMIECCWLDAMDPHIQKVQGVLGGGKTDTKI